MNKVDPKIFRAYDIRGVYGVTIDEDIVYRVAQAYVSLFKPKSVVLGRDVRESGPSLWEAAKNGFIDSGVDVIDVGTISTDMLYFTVAYYGYDGGITISASHNPKEFNGVKMVRQNAQPISSDSGILDIRDFVLAGTRIKAERTGTVTKKDIIDDYCNKVLSFLNTPLTKEYSIVANASFGVAGLALRRLIEIGKLPIHVKEINFEPDGTFSKGNPNPLTPESTKQSQDIIRNSGKIDFAVAWDCDADRCFFFDENGDFILGNYTAAILAEYFLEKNSKSPIITNESVYLAVKDVTDRFNSKLILHRTGHSFIKATMRKEDCDYAGEASGHYYFKDFFFADNGMIPLMIILNLLEEKHCTVSELYSKFRTQFFVSGELNTDVKDNIKVMDIVKKAYMHGGKVIEVDGISIEFPEWRFNLRPSNTEPLIRLNVESMNKELMEVKTKEILALIEKNKDVQ